VWGHGVSGRPPAKFCVGSIVLSAKCGGQCGFRVAMPSPTLRSREQAELARFRSFVVKKCGFGLGDSRVE